MTVVPVSAVRSEGRLIGRPDEGGREEERGDCHG